MDVVNGVEVCAVCGSRHDIPTRGVGVHFFRNEQVEIPEGPMADQGAGFVVKGDVQREDNSLLLQKGAVISHEYAEALGLKGDTEEKAETPETPEKVDAKSTSAKNAPKGTETR